jgi:hypothetical protein
MVYDEVIENLSHFHNWSDKFSENYLDGELQKLIVEVVKRKATDKSIESLVDHYFGELINRLDRYTVENVVIVPVAGFDCDAAPPGETVTVGNLTLAFIDGIRLQETIELLENRATAFGRASELGDDKLAAYQELLAGIDGLGLMRIGDLRHVNTEDFALSVAFSDFSSLLFFGCAGG